MSSAEQNAKPEPAQAEQKKSETELVVKDDPAKGAAATTAATTGTSTASGTATAITAMSDKPTPGAKAEQLEPDVPLEGRIFRRKYFVSVSRKNRLIGFFISMVCLATVVYLNISYTPRAEAGSSHIVEIKDAGVYLAMFKGPIADPYNWQNGGPHRRSLRVYLEPLEPQSGPIPKVTEHVNFKNLAGVNYFSVAEFEVAEPGDYLLASKWMNAHDVGEGFIVLEQDPVEKFFARWFCGILGGIAFLIAVGFPVSARMAASTEARPEKPQ